MGEEGKQMVARWCYGIPLSSKKELTGNTKNNQMNVRRSEKSQSPKDTYYKMLFI